MKIRPDISKKSRLMIIAVIFGLVAAILIGLISVYDSKNNEVVVLNYYSQPDKNGVMKDIISDFESLNPRIKINLIELPDNTDDKLRMIKDSFQSETAMADIFGSDSVWPAIFASAGWVQPLDEYLDSDENPLFWIHH